METLELKNPEFGTEAIGNKLADLVSLRKGKTNPLVAAGNMDHDIGVMFMFQAKKGVLSNSGVTSKLFNPYLNSYLVDISTFETLFNTFSPQAKGIKFEFIFISQQDYIKYTRSTNVSTGASEFLYLVATPLDHNDSAMGHYIIFNLGHKFEVNLDFISPEERRILHDNYLSSQFYSNINTYSAPLLQAEGIYYTWADINKILNERNIDGKLYKEVQFFLGEVIELDIIRDYFKDNRNYVFDDVAYAAAYGGNEKRLTPIGKYLPDDLVGKEVFFDMGSLYP